MYDDKKFEKALSKELDSLKKLLLYKNKKYGDSALNPKRVFSKASTEEQLCVRIDDKLSRISNGSTDEDSVSDLLGYLILLKMKQHEDNH